MLKKIAFSLALFFLIEAVSSQTIKENQVDEFTKNKVIRTSWEPLSKNGNIYAHVRGSRINEIFYLDIKIMLAGGLKIGGSIFSIQDGPYIMFKLENDSILTLHNPKYEIACRGCGAINLIGSEGYGVNLKIPLEADKIDYLITHKITKIRLYTTDGYVEGEVKEKFSDMIAKEFKLIKSL